MKAGRGAAKQLGPTREVVTKGQERPPIPPGKLNLVRAALQAGFSRARVAREFGVPVRALKSVDLGSRR